MQVLKKWMHEFIRDERGQSTTEYILILSVVVMIAMKFKQTFQGALLGAVNQLGNQIDGAVSSDNVNP